MARHCSDDSLLAYLDGELAWAARWRVARHLQQCWSCRTRLATTEAQVHALLQKVDGTLLDTGRIRRARDRFFASPEVRRLEFAGDIRPSGWRRPSIAAAVALMVSVSGFALWRIASPAVLREPARPAVVHPVARPAVNATATAIEVPVARLPVAELRPPVTPIPPVVDESIDLDAVELRVHYRLHQLRACMGEGLEVQRGSRRVVVRGVVATKARRQEIEAALGDEVQVELRTVDEMPLKSLDGLPEAMVAGGESCRIPTEPLLLKREPGADAAAVSNQMLRLADTALGHAWALHRFEGLYPAARIARLSETEAGLAYEVLADHHRGLRMACADLSRRLDGLVEPEVSTEEPARGNVLDRVREMHSEVADLFSCGRGGREPAGRLRRVVRLLGTIQ